ncbi:MAG: hypothetical protein DWQ47_17570 [Acidobacteria bacterium]|nr:MAG: hypothetical protein DWQ32_04970 [Acidobacteriota bacterium]REK02151.1 MAG: hypothetical protein DWQ38_07185 [Acidobacteriota bacterium]REK14047.1 MAG: hypothetical protein DWQ43_10660 [Acidobacteriota bacterium]REK42042.1 MAG: hypothetical protein DWQ47_17570 [Acidobacteriota bacterium]
MQAGDRLGRYEIKELVGSGGMGEVYRAEDVQLDRDVALKVLLPEFCFDSERVKRFKFEAKAVSALNHPGIITIHEIVEEDGKLFIATEFVNGCTLRERIERGDLSLYEAIKISQQVADALAVAHDANIVHRDIKPENIMVRVDGYSKVLDFGLAKPIVQAIAGAEDATIQLVKTQPGLVMGSVRYMSPEQARGKETNGTTDVWSLGIVLYEMISGKNPFDGETISDSIAALIHKEPEPVEDVPEEIRRILRKCLNKRSEERYQNIKDLALDLKEVRSGMEQHSSGEHLETVAQAAGHSGHNTSESKTLIHKTMSTENLTEAQSSGFSGTRENTIGWKIGRSVVPAAGIVVVLLALFAGWYLVPSFLGSTAKPFQSLQVSRLTDNGRAHSAAVSPDGRFTVFVDRQDENPRLVVQQIASGSVVEIVPPTPLEFRQPVFSKDGNFVYYVTIDSGVGTLFKVPTLGGKSTEIVVDIDSTPAISSDEKKIAFIRHNPNTGGDTVFVMNADGTDLKPFVQTKQIGFDKLTEAAWTEADEKLLLVGLASTETPIQKMKLIALDAETSEPVESTEVELLNSEGWSYASGFSLLGDGSGYLFVGKKNEEDTRQVWNLRIAEQKIDSVTTDTSDYESLSVSNDAGIIIATKADRIAGLIELEPEGKVRRQLKSESKNFLGHYGIAQMPDGRIIFPKMSGKNVDLYLLEKDGSTERQLTSDAGVNVLPTVTPDGRYVVFFSNRQEKYGIWRMNSDGTDPILLSSIQNGRDSMPQITGDGNTVIFARQLNDGSKGKLMQVPIDGGEAKPLFEGNRSSGILPQINKEGDKLAFVEFKYDESTAEFLSYIKVADVEGGKAQMTDNVIDRELGHVFRWRPDDDALTYIDKAGADNLFEYVPGEKEPKPLTEFGGGMLMNFIWSNDGKSIYAVRGMINSDLVLIRDLAKA